MSTQVSLGIDMPCEGENQSSNVKKIMEWMRWLQWNIFWLGLALFIVAALANMVLKEEERRNMELKCYECITTEFDGRPMPISDLIAPHETYEKDCLKNPVNYRVCSKGQICAFVKVTIGRTSRLERSCHNGTIKLFSKVGCNKPTNTSCFCNTDFCLK